MEIKITKGLLESNCYLISDSGEGAIIDPGADVSKIVAMIEETDCKIKYIIITHTHTDHVASVDLLREKTGAPALIHISEAGYLADSWYNGSGLFGYEYRYREADRFLEDGERLPLGNLELEVIHTPGHTPGCICIKAEDKLFTGDTLFKRSIGRTDLGTGSYKDIKASLKKLMELDESVIVYPGHGVSTTIGYEKKHNRWLD